MKKFIAMILAVVLTITLVACGQKQIDPSTTNQGQQTQQNNQQDTNDNNAQQVTTPTTEEVDGAENKTEAAEYPDTEMFYNNDMLSDLNIVTSDSAIVYYNTAKNFAIVDQSKNIIAPTVVGSVMSKTSGDDTVYKYVIKYTINGENEKTSSVELKALECAIVTIKDDGTIGSAVKDKTVDDVLAEHCKLFSGQ